MDLSAFVLQTTSEVRPRETRSARDEYTLKRHGQMLLYLASCRQQASTWALLFEIAIVGAMLYSIMENTPDLSIIIPAYNEERRLPPTLKRMVKNLRDTSTGTFEIIVIDDGSKDSTSAVAQAFAQENPEVSVVTNKENHGRGFVMRQGMLSAGGRYIIDTDADGSVDDEALPRFYEYLESHDDADVLIGSRTAKGTKIIVPQSPLRDIMSYGFMAVTCILFQWPFVDRINGFKMYRRGAARDVFKNQIEDGFLAGAENIFVAERRGWPVKEMSIIWTDDRDSSIKHPWREAYRSIFGMCKIVLRNWRGEYRKDLQR